MAALGLLTATVAALLAALVNLVLAGHALAGVWRDRARVAFALGPAGVGVWALAWALALLHPFSEATLDVISAWAVVVAVTGFAVEALHDLGPRRALLLALSGIAGLGAAALPQGGLDPFFSLPRALAVIGSALAGAGFLAKLESGAAPSLVRDGFRAVAGSALLYLALAALGLLVGGHPPDPILFPLLAVELLTLLYIVYRRAEVRLMVSRALVYALLSLAAAAAVTGLYRMLGYPVNVLQVVVTVMVALLVAGALVVFGGIATTGMERILFPGRARLNRALEASRGELSVLRRRLERIERLAIAGEMAATVTHEIKNPLAPIRGYAQLLTERLDRLDEPERAFFAKGLRIISEEADRIDSRVGELLRLSRGERTGPGPTDVVDLNHVVLDAVAMLEAEPGEHVLEPRLDPGALCVIGREDELLGALINLLKNAVEAMRGTDGTRIEVTTRREGASAVVEVRDEGTGIDAADAERAFQPFFTTKQEGTGLGLAVAQSAVQAAGGRIRLSPRADRRGCVARVELPVVR